MIGKLDYLANRLANGSFPGNANYIFSKEDWVKFKEGVQSIIEEAEDRTAKSFGGCTICYGKGYATVNDRWVGYDTDEDIGSPGGTIVGGKNFVMKFCVCDRGKQLKGLLNE
jgi:hypothetical protein